MTLRVLFNKITAKLIADIFTHVLQFGTPGKFTSYLHTFFSLVHCNHPVMDQIPLILEDKYFDINKDFVQFQRCLFWNLRTKTDQYSRRQCVRYTR